MIFLFSSEIAKDSAIKLLGMYIITLKFIFKINSICYFRLSRLKLRQAVSRNLGLRRGESDEVDHLVN
jgi:hypothetical protein